MTPKWLLNEMVYGPYGDLPQRLWGTLRKVRCALAHGEDPPSSRPFIWINPSLSRLTLQYFAIFCLGDCGIKPIALGYSNQLLFFMADQALQVMLGQISLGIVDLSSNIFETTSSIISIINHVREAHVQSVCMENSSRLSPKMGHDANFWLGKSWGVPSWGPDRQTPGSSSNAGYRGLCGGREGMQIWDATDRHKCTAILRFRFTEMQPAELAMSKCQYVAYFCICMLIITGITMV